MGVLVWGPLAQGLLTGRVRRGGQNDLRRAGIFRHLAMAFTIAHPGVTSALLGARTAEQLDDLLTGLDVTLSDEILDRIDEIVPPGTDVGTLDQAYLPPSLTDPALRRRPAHERSAGKAA